MRIEDDFGRSEPRGVLKFGTSGLRGLVTEMTDPVCAAYAGAFLRHLGAGAATAVWSARTSGRAPPGSPPPARGAIRADGVTAVDCGVVPTPALALEAGRRGAARDHGHRQPHPLRPQRPEVLPPRRRDHQGRRGRHRRGARRPRTGTAVRAGSRPATERRPRTTSRATSTSSAPAASPAGASALYQHSAAGRDLIGRRLGGARRRGRRPRPHRRLRADRHRGHRRRGRRARSRAWVAEHRLAALVSTDGDGDRPLIADETGAVLRGDAVGTLAARALGADAVATPLNASTALERIRLVRAHCAAPASARPTSSRRIEALRADGARLAGRLRGERRLPARRHRREPRRPPARAPPHPRRAGRRSPPSSPQTAAEGIAALRPRRRRSRPA